MPENESFTRLQDRRDSTSEIRTFASWMGLVIIAFGVAVAGYLFWHIGKVLLDPRSFETPVDRWEFVVRGRTTDAFPDAYETPEGRVIGNAAPSANNEVSSPDNPGTATTEADRVEEMARLAGRIGSKSSRPMALFIIVLVISIMVRIAIAVINAGIRLAYISAGEKDYMKRIIDELMEQRNQGK